MRRVVRLISEQGYFIDNMNYRDDLCDWKESGNRCGKMKSEKEKERDTPSFAFYTPHTTFYHSLSRSLFPLFNSLSPDLPLIHPSSLSNTHTQTHTTLTGSLSSLLLSLSISLSFSLSPSHSSSPATNTRDHSLLISLGVTVNVWLHQISVCKHDCVIMAGSTGYSNSDRLPGNIPKVSGK